MAYNVKYKLEYGSRGNYTTVIDILKKDYVGGIIELIGSGDPFQLTYEASDQRQYSIFKSSHATLTVIESTELRNDFKEIEDEDNYILRYSRNGVNKWSGYILAEQYSEGDDPNDPFITLKFYDAISRLKVYNILDLSINQTLPTINLKTLFSAVNEILYSNFDSTSNILFNNFLVNAVDFNAKLLDVIYLQRISFFDRDNNPLNLYDILSKIAMSFNFTYLLYRNRFTITNFEFSKNPKFFDYEVNLFLNLDKHVSIDQNHYWIGKSKFTTHWDSMKKIEVFHKFDEDPNFINSSRLDNIVMLREYINGTLPIITSNQIEFNTFADIAITRSSGGTPSRSYKDVYVENTDTQIQITNNDVNPSKRRYKLTYKFRFEFDYGISEAEFNTMTVAQKEQLERDIKEVEDFTDVRVHYRIKNTVGYTNYWLSGGRIGNAPTEFQTFERDLEVNNLKGVQENGFDSLLRGVNFDLDLTVRQGTNNLYFRFYQPYVVTDVSKLNANNTRRIQGVKFIIEDLSFVDIKKIGIEEYRHLGETNRNVFNYNLNRDREYFYLNIEETFYPYALVNSDNLPIAPNSFRRYTRTYSRIRQTLIFDIHSLLITQNLEQLETQQQYVTGNLMVYDNIDFDIFNTVGIGTKDHHIHKFTLNDKSGVYSIELIEIK